MTPTFGGVLGLATVAAVGVGVWWIYKNIPDLKKKAADAADAAKGAADEVKAKLSPTGVPNVLSATFLPLAMSQASSTAIKSVWNYFNPSNPGTTVAQDKVQGELEQAVAAGNSFGADTDNWFVG